MDIVSYRRGDAPSASPPAAAPSRVDWVDTAKGICIVLVVTMHATLGVEEALGREGFMHWVVAYSKPFRLPDFFLVSGLFLARVIDRDWRVYADKRVLHFAYFYLLWLLIQSSVKAGQVSGGTVAGFGSHLLLSLVEPFSTLWFVYALAVFSVVTKLLRPLPKPPVLAFAALLQILPVETSWVFLDELCERWVYFLAGYMLAGPVFRLAAWSGERVRLALVGLAAWALANGVLALTPVDLLGARTVAELPVVGLVAGGTGAVAIVTLAALLARFRLDGPLRYAGSKSLAIYLTFFLPMAFTRLALIKVWPDGDAGVVAAIVTVAAVSVPLVVERTVRDTRFAFLYRRPAWAHMRAAPPHGTPAERPVSARIDLGRALRPQRAGAD